MFCCTEWDADGGSPNGACVGQLLIQASLVTVDCSVRSWCVYIVNTHTHRVRDLRGSPLQREGFIERIERQRGVQYVSCHRRVDNIH